MSRIVILLALAAAVYLLIRNFSRKSNHVPPPPTHRDTVQCAQCRTFVPKEEAVNAEGQHFCCPQHARDWKQQH